MKLFKYILLLLLISGCCNHQRIKRKKVWYYVEGVKENHPFNEISYRGHRYIVVRDNGYFSDGTTLIHAEHCKCQSSK